MTRRSSKLMNSRRRCRWYGQKCRVVLSQIVISLSRGEGRRPWPERDTCLPLPFQDCYLSSPLGGFHIAAFHFLPYDSFIEWDHNSA